MQEHMATHLGNYAMFAMCVIAANHFARDIKEDCLEEAMKFWKDVRFPVLRKVVKLKRICCR